MNSRTLHDPVVAIVMVTLLAFMSAAGVIASLTFVFIVPIDLPFQHVNATIDATANVTGHSVRVAGTTALPDGSVIDYSYFLRRSPAFEAASGQTVVDGGGFEFETDFAGWPSGPAEADLSFSCDWGTEQPKVTTDLVGEQCEHLAGDQVYVDSPGDSKQLYVPVAFNVP